ncbi:F-box associated domain containing protein [Tanacetum coccineum]
MTYHTYMYREENIMHVYSLRTNTWRKVSDSPYNHSQDYCSGVSIKGFLHWIARKRSDRIPVVVVYSLADEEFNEVPSPGFDNDVDILSVNDCKLAAFGEKLAILDHVEGVVWLMNEYGVKESWTKIVVHGLSETPLVEPMIFYDNGKIVVYNHDLKLLNNAEEECLGKSDDVRWDKEVLELEVQEGNYRLNSLFFYQNWGQQFEVFVTSVVIT